MEYEVGGIGAVNPTPQNPDGSVNEDEYRRHINWLVDNGIRFIQPSAATGQSMQTSRKEYQRLLDISVDEIGDQAFVTAYAGRPDPGDTIEMVKIAEDAGAHSAFLIQPFFSTPDQEGLYLYYKAVAKGTKLPLIFYNNPARAGINLGVEAMDRVTDEVPNYVGLKQSNIDEFPESVRRLSGKIKIMPKSEHHIIFGFAFGSPGVLTFAANIVPDKLVAIQTAWEGGDHAAAKDIYLECLPLFDIIHIEPVPNAVFYMLNRMGWNFGTPRIPGHELSEAHKQKVDAVLRDLGLIGQ